MKNARIIHKEYQSGKRLIIHNCKEQCMQVKIECNDYMGNKTEYSALWLNAIQSKDFTLKTLLCHFI